MKITILGCGGSFGSPLAWNRHGNIDLNNKRNFRTRSSVLIEDNNNNILMGCNAEGSTAAAVGSSKPGYTNDAAMQVSPLVSISD